MTGDDRAARRWPPVPVDTLTGAFLGLVDASLPGLVEGLYLHGSLGFGEWYDATSDVDFVAVTSRRPGPDEVAALRDVHERLGETYPRPSYDGFYVTWDDLARPPADCPDVPCILEGDFREADRVDVNPVTWHELAGHGITVRGPRLEDVTVWTDRRALRAYTHGNLAGYWGSRVRLLADQPEEAGAPEAVAWFVLGTSRLHHLLATDELTSKDGAGHHAVEAFGARWRPLVAEALAYRVTGEPIGSAPARVLGEQVAEFAGLVVRAGLAIPV